MVSIGARRRSHAREGGFTLVELTLVIVVIGILIAVGIPTLLGARDRASDTAAKARATHAVKAQKVAASDADQRFRTADELSAEDTSITAEDLPPAGPLVMGVVYVRGAAGDVVTLVSRSATGRCFWTRAGKDGTTEYAMNDCDPDPPSAWKDAW